MKENQVAAEASIELLIVFSVLAISLFICFIDQNGIGVILPTISRDLDAADTISWAGTSALIANTVFQNATMLYVFRGLAGVANGGITSLSMMIVSDIVTLKERGKYQGILGACVGMGNMVGPFIAAAFAQHSTWRGLFWLIDYWGILFGSAAIILILIPVSGGGSYFRWDSAMVIMTLSIVSGQYISRRERYGEVIWLGFFLWTLGVGLTCMFDLNTPIAAIVVILLVQGAGVGLIFQPTLVALQAHCSKAQRAIVISNRNFLRSLGGAVGLAISAAALQNSLRKAMPQEFASALSSYDTPDFAALGASPEQIQEVLKAYAKASRTIFIMNVPFMGLCLLGCLLIKDRGLQRPDELRVAQSSDTINGVEVEKGNGDEIANSILHSDSEFDKQSVSGDLGSGAILFLHVYVIEARQ
ncbi:unnamed protein product [Aureobasidium pullulans]|nr:unnamed protein product [Aureobasidium pullulans]